MEQEPVKHHKCHENEGLHGDEPPQVALAEVEEAWWELREVVHAPGEALRNAPKQRVRAEGNDQRSTAEAGNQRGIEGTACRAGSEGSERRQWQREVEVTPQKTEHHRAQPHHGAYGKVDPPGDDDGRERKGEKAQFHTQSDDFKAIRRRQEIRPGERENDEFQRDNEEERPFPPRAVFNQHVCHRNGNGGR